jgi:iron(III) transport system substrate-binding protein
MRTAARRRTLAAVSAALACALLLGACAAPSRAGDALTVLCSNDATVCERWAQEFADDTGIHVTIVRMPTSEALARLEQGRDTPEFDVWHGGPAEFYARAASEGLLSSADPTGASAIPQDLRDPAGRWTGVYASMLSICADPRQLDALGIPVPSTWDDLLDPALRGRLVLSSPRTSGTAYTVMFVQFQRLGHAGAHRYLSALYGQVQQFTRSGTGPARALIAGDAAVAVTFAPYCSAAATPAHPLSVVLPADGTGYEIGAVALVRGSRHPDLARRYLAYAVSTRGQTACRRVGIPQLPTDPDLPGSLPELLAETPDGILPADIDRRDLDRDRLMEWFAEEGFDG